MERKRVNEPTDDDTLPDALFVFEIDPQGKIRARMTVMTGDGAGLR